MPEKNVTLHFSSNKCCAFVITSLFWCFLSDSLSKFQRRVILTLLFWIMCLFVCKLVCVCSVLSFQCLGLKLFLFKLLLYILFLLVLLFKFTFKLLVFRKIIDFCVLWPFVYPTYSDGNTMNMMDLIKDAHLF